MRLLFLLGLIASPVLAVDPIFRHKDSTTQQEFENVYFTLGKLGTSVSTGTVYTPTLPLLPGDTNYIQSRTTYQQDANFNVSTGTAKKFTVTNSLPASLTLTVTNTNNASAAANAVLELIVGGTSAGDAFINWARSGDGTAWYMGPDNSASNQMTLGYSAGTLPGNADAIRVTTAGEITHPLQPSFMATAPVNTANVTGDGTLANIEFDVEVYDRGSDFNTTNFTFTAPVTGIYFFSTTVDMSGVGASMTFSEIQIVTSNREYRMMEPQVTVAAAESMLTLSVFADMDTNDTAIIKFRVSGGAKTVEPAGDARYTYFTGGLIH